MKIPIDGNKLEYHLNLILNNKYPGEYYEGVVLHLKKEGLSLGLKVSYCYEKGSYYAQVVKINGDEFEYSRLFCSNLETANLLRINIAKTLHLESTAISGIRPELPSIFILPSIFKVTEIDDV